MFTNCISTINDLRFWIKDETSLDQAKQYQIGNMLYKTEIKVNQISHEISDFRIICYRL